MRIWMVFLILFSGGLTASPAIAATPVANEGLTVSTNGGLLLRGRPFRGIGVNYYDLFVRTLENPTNRSYQSGLRALAKARIPFVRFSAGGYWPSEWALYQKHPEEHFARLDQVVKEAEATGIGLIPSLFWLSSTVPDLVGEPSSRWGDAQSQTQAFMRRYTREVVARYRKSRAIWGWEFGNEYNLPADLPNAAEHRPPIVPSLGTPGTRSAADDLTHAQIRSAFRAFAEEVRRHDPTRAIFTGNAFPRVSAWHQATERSWKRDTAEQFAEVLGADNPDPVNTLCVRGYDLESDFSRLPQAMSVARQLGKPLFVGEFGVPGEITPASQASFRKMLDAMQTNQVPLAALWVYDFEGQAKDWSVTSTNGRAWQLEEIEKANREWQPFRPKLHSR